MKNEESTAPQLNTVLTQSLHLKYTCGIRAVSNSSSLYTIFYSVIYNSVVLPLTGSSFSILFN